MGVAPMACHTVSSRPTDLEFIHTYHRFKNPLIYKYSRDPLVLPSYKFSAKSVNRSRIHTQICFFEANCQGPIAKMSHLQIGPKFGILHHFRSLTSSSGRLDGKIDFIFFGVPLRVIGFKCYKFVRG